MVIGSELSRLFGEPPEGGIDNDELLPGNYLTYFSFAISLIF